MSKYKVIGWYQYRVYKYVEADSKEQAIDIACQGSPLHEWDLEINQGAYREEVESAEEGDPVLEPTPYQAYLKDKQKKWWGYDKHMRLPELDEEEV